MRENEDIKEKVVKFWDINAELWSEQVRKGMDGYRELLNNPAFFEFIGDLKDKKILDAGCGEGYNTRILARKGAKVTGIDISRKMIKLAQEEEKKEPLGIQYRVASLTDLSFFPDNSFDTIISFMVFMDLSDYEESLSELLRVLQKNGDLFFSITHPCFTTKGLGWLQDGEGNITGIIESNYFDKKPIVDQWKFTSDTPDPECEPFKIPFFNRTLTDYVNGLMNSGFTLKKIIEPCPEEEVCEGRPWLKKWRDHGALFIYFHALKF